VISGQSLNVLARDLKRLPGIRDMSVLQVSLFPETALYNWALTYFLTRVEWSEVDCFKRSNRKEQ